MIEHEHEDNLLKQALGGFMEELVSSEELEPDRIVAVGRDRRRRRRVAASLGGAAAVLVVASGVAYGVGSSGGSTVGPASQHTTTARVTSPAKPKASVPPASELKGKLVSEGTTNGLSWKIGAALDGYTAGNDLPQFCIYVWTSNGSTDPTVCNGPAQPDPTDPLMPDYPQAGSQFGMLAKGAPGFSLAEIYTAHVTKLVVTYTGGSFTLHPVDLGHGVSVTGVVLPKDGGTMVASGPGGTGQPINLGFQAPR